MENEEQETRIATFTSQSGDQVVIDEFNECVSAYFIREEQFTGYVWLFNVGAISGTRYEDGPNPVTEANCVPHRIDGPFAASDFRAMFNDQNQKVGIYYKDRLTAIIWDGARPGKSAYATAETMAAIPMNQA